MAISENGISFFGSGGHSHNGVNSSIIDVGSYSLFDFSLGYKGSQSRINTQGVNQGAMEEWIIRIVNSKVLQPAGLTLDPNTLSGKAIRANTITATALQANTITADEIASNTITANELTTNLVLVNNIIQSNVYTAGSAGWQIAANGKAEFSDITIRGDIYSSTGTIGGFTLSSTTLSATSGDFDSGPYASVVVNSNGLINSYYQDLGIMSSFYENVKINNYAAGGNGAINITGTASGSLSERWYTSYGVYNPSDIRLKNIIEEDVDALSLLNNIQTTKFSFKSDESQRQHFGFIAQQINDCIPNVAIPGGDNPYEQPWGIVQEVLIPYLVKSIQQLTKKIEDLENKGV
jgi:hypothetical protein